MKTLCVFRMLTLVLPLAIAAEISAEGALVVAPFPFVEDFEQGDGYWCLDGTWGITTNRARSLGHSLTDSPAGNYASDLDTTPTLALDLRTAVRPLLCWWQRFFLELDTDFGYVELSTTEGTTWKRLAMITGTDGSSWRRQRLDLAPYAGRVVWIRFRLITRTSNIHEGWSIDDLEARENEAWLGYPFVDEVESGSATNWVAARLG